LNYLHSYFSTVFTTPANISIPDIGNDKQYGMLPDTNTEINEISTFTALNKIKCS